MTQMALVTQLSYPLEFPWRQVSTAQMALVLQQLADLGYGIVSREDNVFCACCTELTFLRVRCSHP
jgi:hypothetical protein